MSELTEFNIPSFFGFPYHTDRTAWRAYGLPMILVVPHARDISGDSINGSGVKKVTISVLDTGVSPVAGHDHVGVFNPEFSLLDVEINEAELIKRSVDLNAVTYLDVDGEPTTAANAEKIEFTCRAGIIGDVKYLPHANYFDISDVKVDVETLPPDRYVLSYQATYDKRKISDNNELLCIEDLEITTSYKFVISHPGEVILMMVESTPSLYFGESRLSGAKKSEDTTIEFYRPFSDALQDIHDEQFLLERVNWVYDTAPENIPYLGFVLGWELPYFPQSVDALRRAVLRSTVRLQKLKGSRRAVKELFDLFGFAASIANVWWTPDGKYFAAPGEQLPPEAESFEIGSTRTVTTEPLLLEFTEDGFGRTTVPLIYNVPDRSVTVRAYVATRGTAAHAYLSQIGTELSSDFDALDAIPPNHYTTLDSSVSDVESLAGLAGASTALVGTDGYISSVTTSGDAPILKHGIKHNYISNIMNLELSRYYEFDSDGTVLYIFATCVYDKISVPTSMSDLQSNRFDIVLTKKDGEQVDPDVILFLVDFLFKIKAFHSLLRKVIITLLASDTYQVTDYCIGGRVQQDIASDVGQQQTPPEAIIPTAPGDCPHYTPEEYGFRRWDIEYRERILEDLEAEFDAWASLESNCAANPEGQDRTTETRDERTILIDAWRSDEDQSRTTHCTLDGTDYCYKGRVDDRTSYQMVLKSDETWRFKPCALGMGAGVYYTYSAPGFLANEVLNPYLASTGWIHKYISWMGHKYRAYSRTDPNSIHYSGHQGFDASDIKYNWLAINRPSLDVQRDNLNFPGHRLPGMGALEEDFTHPVWRLKPWDIPIDCGCNKPRYADPLNAELVLGSGGSESLVFDDTPYTIEGNGLIPDISGLAEHVVGSGSTISSADDVTHSIYGDMTGGHAAINLQGLVQSIGVIDVSAGSFGSAVDCDSTTRDYSDGYPADSGFLGDDLASDGSSAELGGLERIVLIHMTGFDVVNPPTFPFADNRRYVGDTVQDAPAGAAWTGVIIETAREGYLTSVSDILVWLDEGFSAADIDPSAGVRDVTQSRTNAPFIGDFVITAGVNLMFSLSSQIVVDQAAYDYDYYRHLRLDCGCLHLVCASDSDGVALAGETGPVSEVLSCTVADFLSEYGSADNDQVEYDRYMLFDEIIDTPLYGMDDDTTSLLTVNQTLTSDGWVLDENGGPGADPFPPDGEFSYKDSYGTIHEINWETIDYYLDIVTITKEPRVWGVSNQTGSLINREVWRNGIITTTRQIFISTDNGWQLTGEASEQVVGLFKSTYLCSPPFTDPFPNTLNHGLQDILAWAVTCGPAWASAEEDSSENVEWAGVSGPGAGVQPLMWIDIFGEQDITMVCG